MTNPLTTLFFEYILQEYTGLCTTWKLRWNIVASRLVDGKCHTIRYACYHENLLHASFKNTFWWNYMVALAYPTRCLDSCQHWRNTAILSRLRINFKLAMLMNTPTFRQPRGHNVPPLWNIVKDRTNMENKDMTNPHKHRIGSGDTRARAHMWDMWHMTHEHVATPYWFFCYFQYFLPLDNICMCSYSDDLVLHQSGNWLVTQQICFLCQTGLDNNWITFSTFGFRTFWACLTYLLDIRK